MKKYVEMQHDRHDPILKLESLEMQVDNLEDVGGQTGETIDADPASLLPLEKVSLSANGAATTGSMHQYG